MYISAEITRVTLRILDRAARLLPSRSAAAAHLETGRRGEEEAYFYLRRQGYVIIARNYRSPRCKSELDIVGWDHDTLCFVEVKTRTTRSVQPAEAAVDPDKRRDLSQVARDFLRRMKGEPPFRFDIVSVYLEKEKSAEITLFRNAFPLG